MQSPFLHGFMTWLDKITADLLSAGNSSYFYQDVGIEISRGPSLTNISMMLCLLDPRAELTNYVLKGPCGVRGRGW